MKTFARFATLLVLLLAPALCSNASPAGNQTKAPFLGTWMLDGDKSKFFPGPVAEDRTMTFEAKDGGLRHTTKTRNLFLGGTDDIDYTAQFDGKDYPITGTGLDTVSLKRVDANTIERTGKVRGKPTETCTMKVSPDGKTLTMTVKGSYNGIDYSSTQVFERQ
jgi:hypothetical protein